MSGAVRRRRLSAPAASACAEQHLAWRLGRDVHLAVVDDDIVLLDVQNDAYLCLPCASGQLQLMESGAVVVADPILAADLSAADLITCETDAAQRSFAVAQRRLPTLSIGIAGGQRPGIWDLLDLMVCTLDVALNYRGRTLADLLRQVRDGRFSAPSSANPSPALLAEVARFQRWAPFAPVPGKCLLRAFMLLRLLQRRGHDVHWVFAVRTWPFAAHCWLQAGDTVLDDHADRLTPFTPILVV